MAGQRGKKSSPTDVSGMLESIIGCKWSMTVLSLLRQGINRPGALVDAVDGLTTKVLNERLRKFLRFGIVEKIIHPVSPPHVEYRFTTFGERFLTLVDAVEALQRELEEPEVKA